MCGKGVADHGRRAAVPCSKIRKNGLCSTVILSVAVMVGCGEILSVSASSWARTVLVARSAGSLRLCEGQSNWRLLRLNAG